MSRLMLRCPMPATEPRNIDSTDRSATICRQSSVTPPNPSNTSRAKSAIAATFGAVARNAVTGVGAPS
jgi:hypothetical protein